MTAPKTLFLHIGHNKTGSSYIQSCLALSVENLARRGLAYPAPGTLSKAMEGHTTSGNGSFLARALDHPEMIEAVKEDKLVVSSEMIYRWIQDGPFREKLARFAFSDRIASVRVLLFVRDPVSLACAAYRQTVKNNGAVADIETFFRTVSSPVSSINGILDFFEGLPECRLTVRNYSSARNEIVPILADFLEMEHDEIRRPQARAVNRSLTASELEFQRLLNKRLGRDARLIGNRFSDRLPEIESHDVRPALGAQEELWARLSTEIEGFNRRADSRDRYDRERDIRPGTHLPADAFTFNAEQLEVIADVVTDALASQEKHQAELKELKDRLRNRIRQNEMQQFELERLRNRSLLGRLREELRRIRRA